MRLRLMMQLAVAALACCLLMEAAASASATLPPVKHVFVLIDENKSESTTFGVNSPAPYLSKTLASQGAFLPYYYGIGHSSLDNYIAMVSGQAPNPSTSADCGTFADFPSPTSTDAYGQENGSGCVYPAGVPTLMGQLDSAGLTWRGYMDGMGADPARESATCGHPALNTPDLTEGATALDQYATRHDPFVYFHSVIDNQAQCDAHVVNLSQLPSDLQSAATTPNFVFITPNLCNDGHDPSCANGGAGGLAQADTFLTTWVPRITHSPAFQQDGLLIVAFDEAVGDSTACCGETPGPTEAQPGGSGPGGGVVGAVLLSPYIVAGTQSSTPYNHYSMLGSVEDLFGLPRLADANGVTGFGADIYTKHPTPPPPPVTPQDSSLKLTPATFAAKASKHHKHPGTTISYRDSAAAVTTLTVVRLALGSRSGSHTCKVLKAGQHRPKHSKPCTVANTAGTLRHTDTAGANSVAFSGKLKGHALSRGSYLLEAVPTLAQRTGTRITAHFHVL